MTSQSIEITDRSVTEALKRIIESGRNLTPANRAISQLLASRTEANFAAQSGPTGPWAPLKDKKRAGGKILQDSGRLAASVTPFWSQEEAGIGSNAVYAAIQHQGGDIARAAYSMMLRHRTNAAGELLRTEHFKGKGLVFAKNSHKRVRTTWAEVAEHTIHIPARPYMPATQAGLQAGVAEEAMGILARYLTTGKP